MAAGRKGDLTAEVVGELLGGLREGLDAGAGEVALGERVDNGSALG